MRTLLAEPAWLRAHTLGAPVGVDKDNQVIRGYVLAQRGPFKSEGRGEFDDDGLRLIVEQVNARPAGVKSRFAHPGLSADGIGTFLGRARNARVDGDRARADLHLDPSSFRTPSGDLGGYVMQLAASDPAAFGSSLVLTVDKKYRLTEKGERQQDDKGKDLPPLWYPKKIHASDIVDEGDAVHDGFLAAGALDVDELPDAVLWRGAELLNQVFAGQTREVVKARCLGFLERYLEARYGAAAVRPAGPDVATLRRRLQAKLLG